MREHQHLSFTELIEELQALVINRCTGIMFIRTDTDHSVRIGLQKGRVVSYNYRMHQRQKAMSLIRRIRSGEYSFTQDVPNIAFGEVLPASFDFFRELAAAPDQEPDVTSSSEDLRVQKNPAGAAASPSMAARQESSPGATDLRLNGDKLFEAVVHELMVYMGPIARMMAMEYEQELHSVMSGEQVRAIVFRLAQEIGDARQAKEFETRILGLVSSWQGPADS